MKMRREKEKKEKKGERIVREEKDSKRRMQKGQ